MTKRNSPRFSKFTDYKFSKSGTVSSSTQKAPENQQRAAVSPQRPTKEKEFIPPKNPEPTQIVAKQKSITPIWIGDESILELIKVAPNNNVKSPYHVTFIIGSLAYRSVVQSYCLLHNETQDIKVAFSASPQEFGDMIRSTSVHRFNVVFMTETEFDPYVNFELFASSSSGPASQRPKYSMMSDMSILNNLGKRVAVEMRLGLLWSDFVNPARNVLDDKSMQAAMNQFKRISVRQFLFQVQYVIIVRNIPELLMKGPSRQLSRLLAVVAELDDTSTSFSGGFHPVSFVRDPKSEEHIVSEFIRRVRSVSTREMSASKRQLQKQKQVHYFVKSPPMDPSYEDWVNSIYMKSRIITDVVMRFNKKTPLMDSVASSILVESSLFNLSEDPQIEVLAADITSLMRLVEYATYDPHSANNTWKMCLNTLIKNGTSPLFKSRYMLDAIGAATQDLQDLFLPPMKIPIVHRDITQQPNSSISSLSSSLWRSRSKSPLMSPMLDTLWSHIQNRRTRSSSDDNSHDNTLIIVPSYMFITDYLERHIEEVSRELMENLISVFGVRDQSQMTDIMSNYFNRCFVVDADVSEYNIVTRMWRENGDKLVNTVIITSVDQFLKSPSLRSQDYSRVDVFSYEALYNPIFSMFVFSKNIHFREPPALFMRALTPVIRSKWRRAAMVSDYQFKYPFNLGLGLFDKSNYPMDLYENGPTIPHTSNFLYSTNTNRLSLSDWFTVGCQLYIEMIRPKRKPFESVEDFMDHANSIIMSDTRYYIDVLLGSSGFLQYMTVGRPMMVTGVTDSPAANNSSSSVQYTPIMTNNNNNNSETYVGTNRKAERDKDENDDFMNIDSQMRLLSIQNINA